MTKKTAYLTIDDSPSNSFHWKMNLLYEKNIPAIFFCIGNLLEKHPKQIIEAIKKGFVIANHSYSHPHFSNISLEQAQEEIEKTDQIIDELYKAAGQERGVKWFRFPYGDKGDKKYGRVLKQSPFSRYYWKKQDKKRKEFIQDCLIKKGYTQPAFSEISYQYMHQNGLFKEVDWHWTFDVMEWAVFEEKPTFGLKNLQKIKERLHTKNPPDCRGEIVENHWMESDSPEIILLHDQLETDAIFKKIIEELTTLTLDFQSI